MPYPTTNAFYCKLPGIMISAQVDKTSVVIEYIYPVGSNLPQLRNSEVMIQYFTRIFLRSVFLSIVLEVTNQLLFLGIC